MMAITTSNSISVKPRFLFDDAERDKGVVT